MAIKPGRPVAMGVIDGTPFIGLPGNPVASFVTFAYVVRPVVLALAGAIPEPLVALPVRADFSYKKKKGRREYVRASLEMSSDGPSAQKFPREGAGLLSSLCETDGLVELGEEIERVAPGDSVGFLALRGALLTSVHAGQIMSRIADAHAIGDEGLRNGLLLRVEHERGASGDRHGHDHSCQVPSFGSSPVRQASDVAWPFIV